MTETETANDARFNRWLASVDAIVSAKYGLGVDDGIDWPSRDSFDDGKTPAQGARAWKRAQSFED